jgi:outer membrane protein OmpA-like peptidoglycan-associated protein
MKRLVVICLWGLFSVTATAQADRERLSVEAIVEKLSPAPKTRGLTRNLVPTPTKVDLTIHFDFNSNKLQDQSKPQLDNLAAAMRTERLSELKFRVEGHTDAKGTAAYNEALSKRRADAVVSYLSQQGIDTARLQPEGKGFRELSNTAEPLSALNRRVSIVTVD